MPIRHLEYPHFKMFNEITEHPEQLALKNHLYFFQKKPPPR